MVRNLMVFVAAVCSLLGGTQISAAAQEYSGCILTVDPTSVEAGGQVQVTGSGFQPAFETDLALDRGTAAEQALGTVTTAADGSFETTVTIPAGTPAGAHTISAPCAEAPGSGLAESDLTVVGGGGGTDGTTDGTTDGATDGTDGGTDGATDGGDGSTDGGTDGAPPTGIEATLTLSKSLVQRLESFVATVTGAQPGSVVDFAQFSVRVPVGSAVADGNGVARLEMSFPASATLGPHEVEAQGTDKDGDAFTLRRPITVVAVSAGGGSVPRTGSDAGPLVLAGGAILVAGAGLVVAGRRRRASALT